MGQSPLILAWKRMGLRCLRELYDEDGSLESACEADFTCLVREAHWHWLCPKRRKRSLRGPAFALHDLLFQATADQGLDDMLQLCLSAKLLLIASDELYHIVKGGILLQERLQMLQNTNLPACLIFICWYQ